MDLGSAIDRSLLSDEFAATAAFVVHLFILLVDEGAGGAEPTAHQAEQAAAALGLVAGLFFGIGVSKVAAVLARRAHGVSRPGHGGVARRHLRGRRVTGSRVDSSRRRQRRRCRRPLRPLRNRALLPITCRQQAIQRGIIA